MNDPPYSRAALFEGLMLMQVAGDPLDRKIADTAAIGLGTDESPDAMAAIEEYTDQMRSHEPVCAR